MTNKSPLTRVHAAIVKVCPEIEKGCTCFACQGHSCCADMRKVTLADVLRAIEAKGIVMAVTARGQFMRPSRGDEWDGVSLPHTLWDTTHDSLDAQSPETISFLEGVLCN